MRGSGNLLKSLRILLLKPRVLSAMLSPRDEEESNENDKEEKGAEKVKS